MTPAHVIIPFLVSFLIMTCLALFAWQRRAERASRIFFIFTLLVLLWLGGIHPGDPEPDTGGETFLVGFPVSGHLLFPGGLVLPDRILPGAARAVPAPGGVTPAAARGHQPFDLDQPFSSPVPHRAPDRHGNCGVPNPGQ